MHKACLCDDRDVSDNDDDDDDAVLHIKIEGQRRGRKEEAIT